MITNNISTVEMNHDEWLKRRFESIGASESGSILGINPWKTAVDVYYEKVDRVTDFPDNLNMWLGRELEPVIKKRFEEESELLGKKPIITYEYWKMMAKDVQDKLENFSTQKANRQSIRYNEEIKQYD